MYKMKKFKFFAFALLAVLTSAIFASCSDDDKDVSSNDIVGTWECVSGKPHGAHETDEESDFTKGTLLKFLKGGKCFIGYGGDFYVSEGDATDPTEDQWDPEGNETYTLKGNILTIIESDLDRYVGTIEVKDNVMTYNYTYQDYRSGKMASESGPYVSTFKKK